jgi:hypothetical protein
MDQAAKPARLHVYTTFTTWSSAWTSESPVLRRLKEELSPDGIDVAAVPVDAADDNAKLAEYARQWKPVARLLDVPPAKRADVASAYAAVLGRDVPLPSTVITDDSGHIYFAEPGLPNISQIRKVAALEQR